MRSRRGRGEKENKNADDEGKARSEDGRPYRETKRRANGTLRTRADDLLFFISNSSFHPSARSVRRFHISGKVVPNSVVRLVALPKEDSEEKKETETEENCDEQNYKVVESCVGDGCGETGCSSKGEEKKEECCGTGDCQSVENVEEEKVDASDTSSFTDVKFMVAVTLPAVAGLSLVIYAIVKSLKRR